jgi:hypothetical protein
MSEQNRVENWPDTYLERLEQCATRMEETSFLEETEDQFSSNNIEARIRTLILDLRAEISERDIGQRELMLRTLETLQKLKLEVRDLRYALLLATSRKDRRRGLRWVSRLLNQ